MHLCVLHDIPVTPVAPETFRTFQSFMTSSLSRKLHRVPVGQLQTLQTFILQRKGDVAISVKLTDSP